MASDVVQRASECYKEKGRGVAGAIEFFFTVHSLLDSSEVLRPGDQVKRGRRKGRNKQEAPVHVEAEQPVEEVKTPLDLAKVGAFVVHHWVRLTLWVLYPKTEA